MISTSSSVVATQSMTGHVARGSEPVSHGLSHGFANRLRVGNISRHMADRRALCPKPFSLGRKEGAIHIDEEDGSRFANESLGDRQPDTLCRTGDEHALACQTSYQSSLLKFPQPKG